MFAWTRVVTGRYERWLDSRYILKVDVKDLQMDWKQSIRKREELWMAPRLRDPLTVDIIWGF